MTSTEIKKLNDLQQDIDRLNEEIAAVKRSLTIHHYTGRMSRSLYAGLYDEMEKLIIDYLSDELKDQEQKRDMLILCTGESKYLPIDITNL